MGDMLVLSVDLGTQSARAMLIDRTGNIRYKTQHKYETPYFSKNPGWAEQKPEVYWDAVCDCTNRLGAEAEDVWGDIAAVAVTTIRDTCLCVDGDGRPLRDVILWLDKRECVPSRPVPAKNMLLFTMIGMKDTVELQRKVAACNWLMANEPGLWAKTHKFIMISCWLTFMLTGGSLIPSAT